MNRVLHMAAVTSLVDGGVARAPASMYVVRLQVREVSQRHGMRDLTRAPVKFSIEALCEG